MSTTRRPVGGISASIPHRPSGKSPWRTLSPCRRNSRRDFSFSLIRERSLLFARSCGGQKGRKPDYLAAFSKVYPCVFATDPVSLLGCASVSKRFSQVLPCDCPASFCPF